MSDTQEPTLSQMKTIVYKSDGSIEQTANADAIVARGDARYATDAERRSYERQFAQDDARIAVHESTV